MEFRQLEYFCTISELENFTRTAETLHVSQPSVTKAIKALEAELQLTLIDRSQKHVSLTEEGRTFLVHAQKIMRDVEMARQDMQRYRRGTHGIIYFGIPPMVEGYLFPDFFMKFRLAHPNIVLDVHECMSSKEVEERVAHGNLDFGIVLVDPKERDERGLVIMRDSMSLCLPHTHFLANEKDVSFKDLRNEKFLMQPSNTYQYRKVVERCEEAGFSPEIVLCASQLKTIKQLVANETGIAILPDFVTRMEKIFKRKALTPPIELQLVLDWSRERRLSAMDESFLDFARHYTKTEEFKRHFRQ